MTVLTSADLQLLCEDAGKLVGGQLQEVTASDRDVLLEIYAEGKLYTLWIDLHPAGPFFICLDPTETRPSFKKKPTPVSLFLKAHGRGRRVSRLHRTEGRLVELTLGDPTVKEEVLHLALRLFPHGQNLVVGIGEKKIAWQKPKDLGRAPPHDPPAAERTRADLYRAWMEDRAVGRAGAGGATPDAEREAARRQKREKLETILGKLELQLAQWQNPWRRLGEWLKENQTAVVPADLRQFLNPDSIRLSSQVQDAFTRAKKQDQKREGLARRVRELKFEITKNLDGVDPATKIAPVRDSPFHQSTTRGRRAQLTEQIDLFVGKSATDNLHLLRQAQSWDLWLHVKDVPGCHAILRRPRGLEISDELLRVAARKVVQFSPQASRNFRTGDQFDVTICEARFVKPIKGDRLGQVTYHDDKTIRVRM